MTPTVDVRTGNVYLTADVARAYFPDIESVILLIRGGSLLILPVRQIASGGCLLKRRNAAGDRVAAAPDVFHANGLGGWTATGLKARWSPEQGALVVQLLQT